MTPYLKQKARAYGWQNLILQLAPETTHAILIRAIQTKAHVPDPLYFGRDGFRVFSDFASSGGGISNRGGAFPTGFHLLSWLRSESVQLTTKAIKDFLQGKTVNIPKSTRQTKTQPKQQLTEIENRSLRLVQNYWKQAQDNNPDLLNVYLKYRLGRWTTAKLAGIKTSNILLPQSLLSYAGKVYRPALLLALRGPRMALRAIQRVYLDRQPGQARARLTLGRVRGCITRLYTGTDVQYRKNFALAEGFEKAVAIREATGIQCEAVCGSGNFLNFEPKQYGIPKTTKIYICGDLAQKEGDRSEEYARRLATKISKQGYLTYLVFPDKEQDENGKLCDYDKFFLKYGPEYLEEMFFRNAKQELTEKQRFRFLVKKTASAIERFERTYKNYPLKALPDAVQNFIREVAESAFINTGFVAPHVLTTLATAIGNRVKLQVKENWKEPALLWSVVIGDTSSGKTIGLKNAVEPLKDLQLFAEAEYNEEVKQFYKAKAKAGVNGYVPKPLMKNFVVQDSTFEAIINNLKDYDERMLLQMDEISDWFGSFTRYKQGGGQNSDVTRYIKLWDNDTVYYDRKGSKLNPRERITIQQAYMSLSGGIQMEVVEKHFTNSLVRSGFAPRLLLNAPPRQPRKVTDIDINPNTNRAYRKLIETLMRFDRVTVQPREETTVQMTEEAFKLFQENSAVLSSVAEEHREKNTYIDAAIGKLSAYFGRFCLVLHCITYPEDFMDMKVDIDTVKNAELIMQYYLNEAKRIYGYLYEMSNLFEWNMKEEDLKEARTEALRKVLKKLM